MRNAAQCGILFMLTTEQESVLVDYIIEDFGITLSQDDFIDNLLGIFEDIAGMEALSDAEVLDITSRLWRIYRERCRQDS